MIRVGTSGWHYADWLGPFYPSDLPPDEWLSFYATRFATVELNNSFYRLPSFETFGAWKEQVPDGFLVTVKASRYLTHIKRLLEPKEPVERLWSNAGGLGSRLGPVLFQLPPSLAADLDRFRELLRALPGSMRPAFEFRHRSWFRDDVFAAMDEARAALVWADRPGTRIGSLPVIGGWVYIRFHQGRRAAPGYASGKLARWADRIAGLGSTDVFAYFNNDQRAAAPRDAVRLVRLLDERGSDVAMPATGDARKSPTTRA
jgi:uncharacterized protein YecE (DUF72 family)